MLNLSNAKNKYGFRIIYKNENYLLLKQSKGKGKNNQRHGDKLVDMFDFESEKTKTN